MTLEIIKHVSRSDNEKLKIKSYFNAWDKLDFFSNLFFIHQNSLAY
jgi:hypothetical protein